MRSALKLSQHQKFLMNQVHQLLCQKHALWMILTAKPVNNTEKEMLNWDEYNKEETQVAPAIKNTVPEAPKHVEP